MHTADPMSVSSARPEGNPSSGTLADDIVILAQRGGIAIGLGRRDGTLSRPARWGSRLKVRSVEIPLIGGNGEISGVMCRDMPIAERNNPFVHSEPQCQKTEDEIAKVFVHDINNLLSVIGGGLNLLERGRDAATQDAIFARMRKAIARGAALSRSLLDAGRHSRTATNGTTSRADLVAAAETLSQAFSEQTELDIEVSPDLWEFNADPEKLYFALLNLCRNADAAMQPGGVVSISAKNLDPLPAVPQGAVLITVADNGSGMSEKVLSRVFEPYYTTKAAGHGSGLGLAQVRDFVEDNGGAIRLESDLGVGTVVRMVFPRVLCDSPIVGTNPFGGSTHGGHAISFLASPTGGTFLLSNVDDEVL